MKKNKKINIGRIIIGISIIMIIISLVNIIIWYKDNQRNATIKEEIEEVINDQTNKDNEQFSVTIDFDKLKKINSDVVAYLKVNGTKINYTVVKGSDNAYYLKHNFNKEKNRSGWIFMDYHNKYDGTDKNIIIYGHNTLNGSMFGTLRNVVSNKWYMNKDNHIITLINAEEVQYYQVFSTYSIKVEDYYITTDFKNNDEFKTFINNLKARSVYDYGVDVDGDDVILTLSTCTGNGSKRMVLHAKRIMK